MSTTLTKKPPFGKPVSYAEELAAIIGPGPLSRAEVTKRIWAYIKEKQLQDPAKKQHIRLDAALKKIFGDKDVINMFEMTKLLAKLLTTVKE